MILDGFWVILGGYNDSEDFLIDLFGFFFGVAETVSIADSDAQRSVSPLRVRKQRDEV